jgi:hypothetical protein
LIKSETVHLGDWLSGVLHQYDALAEWLLLLAM